METIQVQQNGDVFSCDIGISKEEWLDILKDDKTPQAFKETLLRFYYMPGHRGSCLAVSNKMGGNANALNLYVSKFGQYVKKRLNRFEVYGTDGKATRWVIPMDKGRNLSKKEEGAFEWELRPELVEALREYLYWYLVESYKDLRKELPIRDEAKDWDELYKWELVTWLNCYPQLDSTAKQMTSGRQRQYLHALTLINIHFISMMSYMTVSANTSVKICRKQEHVITTIWRYWHL